MFTSSSLLPGLTKVLYGGGAISLRSRIQCTVKSAFSETRLVPSLNDLLISHPVPASVSRFRIGWMEEVNDGDGGGGDEGGRSAVIRENRVRFNGSQYKIENSFQSWSSGMWICSATGSSAAMSAAGGDPMTVTDDRLQYKIREHLIDGNTPDNVSVMSSGMLSVSKNLHIRWNSRKGAIYVDGHHIIHRLELGDEVVVNGRAPKLKLFVDEGD